MLKRALKWASVAVALLCAAGAVLAFKTYRKLKGSPPPRCAQPSSAPPRRTFAAPRQLSSRSTPGARAYDTEPSAALLPDGTLAFAFNARDSILSATSGLVTGVVTAAGEVALADYPTDRREVFDVWMASLPDGSLRLVWLGHDGGRPERNMRVGWAESSDGRVWSKPRSAQAPADCPDAARGCLDKPMVAGAAGFVHVAYYSDPGDGLRVVSGAADAGPPSGSSVRVSDGTYGDLEATPDALHLVWVGDAKPRPPAAPGAKAADPDDGPATALLGDVNLAVRYARSEDHGKTFSAPVTVSAEGTPVPFLFSNPRVQADDARGLLYVVYPAGDSEGRWNIFLATSRDQGRTWSRIQVNDDLGSCASHMEPHAALDPVTGTLHVTWLENRTGAGGLAWAACEPGGARCGRNELVSDAPFTSYTYERHLPAWLGEYGALKVDAERRVLHAVWTQPVLEEGSPVSRIFYARAALPAGPAAAPP